MHFEARPPLGGRASFRMNVALPVWSFGRLSRTMVRTVLRFDDSSAASERRRVN